MYIEKIRVSLPYFFKKEAQDMAHSAKIRPEQINRARKLLQDLPEKDNRKTRPEAAKLLEKDFRKAMQKGYNAKEISAILKNEGILIPVYLVKDFLSESGETSRSQAAATRLVEKTSFGTSGTSDTES